MISLLHRQIVALEKYLLAMVLIRIVYWSCRYLFVKYLKHYKNNGIKNPAIDAQIILAFTETGSSLPKKSNWVILLAGSNLGINYPM